MWTSITISDLYDQIHKTETKLNGELWNFWKLIKVEPEKWTEDTYGKEGNGFWVVAICGRKVIWYNDIEEGFNISDYAKYGKIVGYFCNQDELNLSVEKLFNLLKFGKNEIEQAGPPQNLK